MAFFSKLFKSKHATVNTAVAAKTQAKPPKSAPSVSTASTVDLTTLPLEQLPPALLQESHAESCIAALPRITNAAELLNIASKHNVAAVRMAAAERITSADDLQQLFTQIKGRDKAVLRLCKERLAELRDVVQQQQARQDRIHYVLSQVKYLTKLGYQPEFSGKLQLLKQEWPELSLDATPEVQADMAQELASAEKILAQHTAEEAAIAAQQQAQAHAKNIQQQLLEQATELLEQAHSAVAETFSEQLQSLIQRWDEALRAHQPAPVLGKAFEQLLQQLLSIQTSLQHYSAHASKLEQWLQAEANNAAAQFKQAEAWLSKLSWPAGVNAPRWHQQLHTKMVVLKGDKAQQQQQQQSIIASIEQQLEALEHSLKLGQVKDANKHNKQVMQALKQLPHTAAIQARRQQQALFVQLQNMHDWAGFATLPKKEALVSAMQALTDSSIAPDALADKIHSLQEEWKTLSHAGVQDHDLWQQFSQAADRAFEPCKTFFAQQAELRAQLLQQRQQLIADLNQYEQGMDWSNADWNMVQKTLDAGRATFRTLGPVERSAHTKTHDQFNAVCDRIYAHLKQEYSRNLARKEDLVAQAAALLEHDKLQGIVDKVKELQGAWKTVGLTPRAPDQKLWQQFRGHCDAIFKRLDAQREERKSEINDTIQQAQALVADALSSSDSKKLHEANQYVHSVSLPKPIFQQLTQQLQQAQTAQDHSARQQALAGLIARIEHLHGKDEQWQHACTLPLAAGFSEELFQQARAGALSSSEQAQDLCILMEIVAEQPSPAAAQSRRMELQVQRLAEGLGKGVSTTEEGRLLVQRWLAVAADAALTQRFLAALQHAL